eukprot:scaffold242232_cov18-Tisochrysis_lutea.AAC.2
MSWCLLLKPARLTICGSASSYVPSLQHIAWLFAAQPQPPPVAWWAWPEQPVMSPLWRPFMRWASPCCFHDHSS